MFMFFFCADELVVLRILVMISKTLVIGGFASLYIVAAELFPSEMLGHTYQCHYREVPS